MSEIFPKSIYTSRSPGYKYRTLSTNTGENRKRRDSSEDNTIDRKFKEMNREISRRIDKEVELTQKARKTIRNKMEIVDTKINSMVDMLNTVLNLRDNLRVVEDTIVLMVDRVNKLEAFTVKESGSFRHGGMARKSSFRIKAPISEELEVILSPDND